MFWLQIFGVYREILFKLSFLFLKVYSVLSLTFSHQIKNYWVAQKLPQIYTANHATFPIRVRKITVQICGNFWVTQ